MTRTLKILFAAMVALWGLVGATGNFASLSVAYEYVEIVTSMSGVFIALIMIFIAQAEPEKI